MCVCSEYKLIYNSLSFCISVKMPVVVISIYKNKTFLINRFVWLALAEDICRSIEFVFATSMLRERESFFYNKQLKNTIKD